MSSPRLALSFLPRMPPVSLMSAIACSAPCFTCAPNMAPHPVMGAPMPMRIGPSGGGLLAGCALAAGGVGRDSVVLASGGVDEPHGRYHQPSTAAPVAASAVPPAMSTLRRLPCRFGIGSAAASGAVLGPRI